MHILNHLYNSAPCSKVVGSPLARLSVTMQTGDGPAKSVLAVTREIAQKEGYRGFFRFQIASYSGIGLVLVSGSGSATRPEGARRCLSSVLPLVDHFGSLILFSWFPLTLDEPLTFISPDHCMLAEETEPRSFVVFSTLVECIWWLGLGSGMGRPMLWT